MGYANSSNFHVEIDCFGAFWGGFLKVFILICACHFVSSPCHSLYSSCQAFDDIVIHHLVDRQRKPFLLKATQLNLLWCYDQTLNLSSISSLTFAFNSAIVCACMADMFTGLQECKLEDPIDARKVNYWDIAVIWFLADACRFGCLFCI